MRITRRTGAHRTSRPHARGTDQRTFTYDANGNQTGWTHDQNGTRRTIVWDDENRIQSLFDNGHEKTYKYDDQGDRVIKRGPQGETVYVNQFFTDRPGSNGTKHVYAGKTRIASKLMRQDDPNANPHGKTPFEKDLYFYHPDHIGSTNFVTDLNGKLYEHLEYFPFGESWVEENSNVQRTPYLFSAKELDEETGLYAFGTRYYDPRTSVWQSADRILDSYLPKGERANELPGMGGIYNPFNLGVYSYAHLNPVRYNDPDGDVPLDTIVDLGFVIYDTGRVLGAGAAYIAGAISGDQALKAEALSGLKDAGGDLAVSGVGLATPYVPAVVTRGARTGTKMLSKGDEVADVGISSIPLSLEPAMLPKKLLQRCAAQLADEYVGLLKQKNGFFAFEGALHALPADKPAKGYGLQTWNDPRGWIAAYGETADDSLFFAEDLFGEQFALKGDAVYRFDPETARFTEIAPSLEGWAKVILEDYRTETGYELAHEWQSKHGALQPTQRLVPKIPFSLGGEYAIANLMALDARKGMELRADIWRQVKDLPPGTKVEIKLTD